MPQRQTGRSAAPCHTAQLSSDLATQLFEGTGQALFFPSHSHPRRKARLHPPHNVALTRPGDKGVLIARFSHSSSINTSHSPAPGTKVAKERNSAFLSRDWERLKAGVRAQNSMVMSLQRRGGRGRSRGVGYTHLIAGQRWCGIRSSSFQSGCQQHNTVPLCMQGLGIPTPSPQLHHQP